LASTRAALARSFSVPARESIMMSLTYLPCEEATEAAVGMEAIVEQEERRRAKGKRERKRKPLKVQK
jgi:hypothetical protein